MTTSSYAVLGLLALRPWSAYDLARQAERSLRFAWPTSERHLYTEPKKLVALGYATMREEPIGPERTRKVYEISPSGREALASWTETAPAPPTFEAETMVRLLFAENGGIDHLRHALEKLSDDTRTLHSWSLDIIDGYVSGDDIPFPDRLHLSVLLASFELELFTMIERWVEFASAEVARWDDTRDPGRHARTARIARVLADRESVLDHADLGDGAP